MEPVRIGLLGCGTVGGGIVQLLASHGAAFERRIGAPLVLARVLVRDGGKPRVPALDRGILTTEAEALMADPSIDVIVEAMGGIEPARGLVERALESGRSVVTANKLLLATHGAELFALAHAAGVDLAFEASVGGGIPIVRALRDAFASDRVRALTGIVNGTSNFILTAMREDGTSFKDALRVAQAKGYAEADPTLDVGGHDAAHKLAILALLAFGATAKEPDIFTEGIDRIEAIDHQFAARFGFVVKHLAIARTREAALELRVHPALVRRGATLAHVDGVLNAIAVEGEALGPCLFSGRGAGDMPTAVSVVADLLDVARAKRSGAAGLLTRGVRAEDVSFLSMLDVETRYYLRFSVIDRPGVLAQIADALGRAGVSIEQMVQERRGEGPVPIVMLTHLARERNVRAATAEIARLDFAVGDAQLLRVEDAV